MARKLGLTWAVFRDRVIFLSGIAGVVHETVVSKGERPALLVLFASMIGLPAFLRKDENSEKNENDRHPGSG